MQRGHARQRLAGGVTLVIFVGLVLLWRPLAQDTQGQVDKKQVRTPDRPTQPIAMSSDLHQIRLALGLKDKMPTDWDGEVQVSAGKVTAVDVVQGNPKASVSKRNFKVRTFKAKPKQMPNKLTRPVLQVTVDAPLSAKLTIKTAKGNFSFALKDVPTDEPEFFLQDQVSVLRQAGAVELTGKDTEDDYPAMARGKKGTVWLAYNEYVPGRPLVLERVLAGNFEELIPEGNGDQVRLMRFDGKQWYPSEPVTPAGLNIWRPTITVDGKDNVFIAWSQQVNENWEIFYRRYDPDGQGENWFKPVRLTNEPGADFHVVVATDSKGIVWLAWQAWRDNRFQIMLAALAEQHPYSEPKIISSGEGNCWSPAVAADSQGNVYVVWDAHDGDNYNVHLYQAGGDGKTITVAGSPRFEARPSVSCDGQDRVWIAYEEGDEQWGKDYANATPQKVPVTNPGNALYLQRTVQVKCLENGQLKQTASDLQKAMQQGLSRSKSLPRLVGDEQGNVWLWLRHHPNPTGAGEVWNSYALRFDGQQWSAPLWIPSSANLLDNRPALVANEEGILEVHSSDERLRSQVRKDNNLYAVQILTPGPAQKQAALVADQPDNKAKLKPVHPNEAKDVARIRAYTIEHNGKKLRLVRGDFHRHTEYSAHRDGDGLFEDSWRYGLDAGQLDWMGNGDHDNGFGQEYPWWQIQKYCDILSHPPRFVAALTYERSNVYPNGHRNVILPKRGIRPLPRGNLKGDPETGTPDTKMLYAYLKRFGGMCASHTSGTSMGTDWRDNDPVVEPVVEIYQGHRHNYEHAGAPRSATKETQIGGFEPAGYVWNAFEKGYKLGFQSSSDHISTHMSYAVVLTEELSRKGIIAAFKKRHSYGATDNIIVDVRSGKYLMGDEFTTTERPTLDISVQGTAPIAKLHVIRNNRYVYSVEPKKQDLKIRFTDMDAEAGKSAYYYVRLEQSDGNLAWASPMWITYRPE
jgi:hypothetical protein